MDLLQQISQNFFAFIVIVGFLVFIHEFGHYYVALRNKVKVEAFSIGFGPELWHRVDKRGTRWRVALIPLGGYVKMFGDVDPASVQTDKEAVAAHTPEERAGAFYAKSVGQRAAIVAAGPGVNFLFTIVALVGLYVTMGQPITLPIVEDLLPGKPAAEAGILPGDRITAINDTQIRRFQEIRTLMAMNLDEPVVVHVDRKGEQLEFQINPVIEDVDTGAGTKHRTGLLGIRGAKVEYTQLSVPAAFGAAFTDTWDMIRGTFAGLYQIIAGQRDSRELGGVLTIAKMSGNTIIEDDSTHGIDITKTIAAMIWLMAMLSANLGLVNLFPIPVLDGGHLMFYAAEAARGKPLSEQAQEYSLRFGLAVVLTLTAFALWNDLRNFGIFDSIARLFS